MDEELQEELVRRFTKRFQKYNETVLYELGQVIKEIGDVIPSDAYKLAQQLKYNITVKDLEKELAKITKKSIGEVHQILEHIAKENIQFAKPYYEAKNLSIPIYEEHKELQKLVNSIASLSSNEFVNIARSTGFKLLNDNKKPLLMDIEETYHKVIDEAVYAATTGKDSYNQLMRETLKQLASSGVRKIEYESGYSRRIDTAVRMNLMDSIRQVSNKSQELFGKEFGADGVEITVHQHPAPDHERCQGRQFSHEEFKKFQNGEKCQDYQGNVYYTTENGKKRRQISEYNCYHEVNQIVLGVDNPLHSNEYLQKIIDDNHKGVEIDGKNYTLYEATQLQRKLETEIRKSKELQIVAKSSGDEELILNSQERITYLRDKYVEVSKQATLQTDIDRIFVPNYKEVKITQNKYDENLIPDFMRNRKIKLTGKNAYKEVLNRIENPSTKAILSKAKIKYGSDVNYYQPLFKTIHFKNNADIYTHAHELAHYLEDKLNIYQDKRFKMIFKNKFAKYTKADYQFVKSEKTGNYYVLKDSSEFVSRYQTRIYTRGKSFIKNKPNLNNVHEYFSMGVEFYFKDKELLKSVDNELYNYIKELF